MILALGMLYENSLTCATPSRRLRWFAADQRVKSPAGTSAAVPRGRSGEAPVEHGPPEPVLVEVRHTRPLRIGCVSATAWRITSSGSYSVSLTSTFPEKTTLMVVAMSASVSSAMMRSSTGSSS